MDDDLSRAVVIWTGWGETTSPSRNDQRLVQEFGPARGLDLVHLVHRLEDDFYRSSASAEIADLLQMGKKAADDFHAAHPEIGEDAVRALAWCYTYDYK